MNIHRVIESNSYSPNCIWNKCKLYEFGTRFYTLKYSPDEVYENKFVGA